MQWKWSLGKQRFDRFQWKKEVIDLLFPPQNPPSPISFWLFFLRNWRIFQERRQFFCPFSCQNPSQTWTKCLSRRNLWISNWICWLTIGFWGSILCKCVRLMVIFSAWSKMLAKRPRGQTSSAIFQHPRSIYTFHKNLFF